MKTNKLTQEGINSIKIVSIQSSAISGIIQAPASKSSMQRACAAALVRKAVSVIQNPGNSNDDKAALQLIADLGAVITNNDDGSVTIDSGNFLSSDVKEVTCGESGLGIRMFAPIIALHDHLIAVNGRGSLLNRPLDFFDEILPELNVEISSNDGKLPLQIKGALQPKNIKIDGSLSSQYLTGLLLAYAALDAKNVTIKVDNLKSKPYINLTLNVMESFLLKVPQNKNYDSFYFDETPVNYNNNVVNYTVEGDWSGSAFLLVAGAVAGNIKITGLNISSTQADKKIMQALHNCGADVTLTENEIKITSLNKLFAFEFDATDCPDLFPPLAALAANCNGTTKITGVHRLTHKESNRALTIREELEKMNIQVELNNNIMLITGIANIRAATVHSHHDHRIAMMCAVLALKADGETTIEEADAVKKSYPDFYQHIQLSGAVINYIS